MDDILLTAEDISDIDDVVIDYATDNGLDVAICEENNKVFYLFTNQECTKMVLFVRRDYMEIDGKLFYVDLHALKSYDNYYACVNDLDGDVHYYAYGEPEEAI